MRSSTNNVICFLAGAAVGAGLEYLLDPDVGHRRRGALGGRIGGIGSSLGEGLRHAGSRAHEGVSHSAHAAGDYLHHLRQRFGSASAMRHADSREGYPVAALVSSVLTAMGMGALLMYVLDPQMGKRRRKMSADQLRSRLSHLKEEARRKARYAAGQIKGYAHEARSVIRTERPGDEQLRERVRAELGHVTDQIRQIRVEVHDGTVTLRGSAAEAEIDRLIAAAKSVRGVRQVECQLQPA